MNINTFWMKLQQNKGEEFRTVSGLPFTYEFIGENSIRVSRANQLISKKKKKKVIEHMPLKGPGEISKLVRGSAYVYALLTDERLQQGYYMMPTEG